MATSTPETPATPSCPTKDPVPYERIIIDLEKRPDLKKEIEDATELLDYVMCRVPDPEDAKYKDDEVGFFFLYICRFFKRQNKMLTRQKGETCSLEFLFKVQI